MERIEIKACNSPVGIEVTQLGDGLLLMEKFENGKYFVSSQDIDGKFYLQENLDGGEIRDMGSQDNLPEAIRAIAWAR